jgi:hypothetical protein
MRLNDEEGNGASLAGRTSPKTARIVGNMAICRILLRSVSCDFIENIALFFFRGLLTDRVPFKAALDAFVAEDHLLG